MMRRARFAMMAAILALMAAAPAAAVDCNPEALTADRDDLRAGLEAYRDGMADLKADRFAAADQAFRRAYAVAGRQQQLVASSLARLVETSIAAGNLNTAWYRLRRLQSLYGTGQSRAPLPAWIDSLIMLGDAATAAVAEQPEVLQTISACRSFGVAPAISLRILFETDSAKLDAAGEAQVARVAQALLAANVTKAILRGHTDEHGTPAYNDALSRARAQTVAQALAQAAPGLQGQLQAEGRGERELLYVSSGAEQDRLNRRVELVLGAP